MIYNVEKLENIDVYGNKIAEITGLLLSFGRGDIIISPNLHNTGAGSIAFGNAIETHPVGAKGAEEETLERQVLMHFSTLNALDEVIKQLQTVRRYMVEYESARKAKI